MDNSLVWDSFVLLESWRLSPWIRESVQDLLQKLQWQHLQPCLLSWTICDIRYVCKIYHHVQLFAADFASSTLSSYSSRGGLSTAPSATETCRIERAFLRFQLYSNLFRK